MSARQVVVGLLAVAAIQALLPAQGLRPPAPRPPAPAAEPPAAVIDAKPIGAVSTVAAFATTTVAGVVAPVAAAVSAVTSLLAPGDLVLKAVEAASAAQQARYAVVVRNTRTNTSTVVAGVVGVPTPVEFDRSHLGPGLLVDVAAVPVPGGVLPTLGLVSITRTGVSPTGAALNGFSVSVVLRPAGHDPEQKLAVGYEAETSTRAPDSFRVQAAIRPTPLPEPGTAITASVHLPKVQPLTLLAAAYRGGFDELAAPTLPAGTSSAAVRLANAPKVSGLDLFLPADDDPTSCTVGAGPAGPDRAVPVSVGVTLSSRTSAGVTAVASPEAGSTIVMNGVTSELPAHPVPVPLLEARTRSVTVGALLAPRDHKCKRALRRLDYEAADGLDSLVTTATITQPRTKPRFAGDTAPLVTNAYADLQRIPPSLTIEMPQAEVVKGQGGQIWCIEGRGLEDRSDRCVLGRENANALLDSLEYKRFRLRPPAGITATIHSVEVAIATDRQVERVADTDGDGVRDQGDYAYLATDQDRSCATCAGVTQRSNVAARFTALQAIDDLVVLDGNLIAAVKHTARPLNVTVVDRSRVGSTAAYGTQRTALSVLDLPANVPEFQLNSASKWLKMTAPAGQPVAEIGLVGVTITDDTNHQLTDVVAKKLKASVTRFSWDIGGTVRDRSGVLGPKRISYDGAAAPMASVTVGVGTEAGHPLLPVVPDTEIRDIRAQLTGIPAKADFTLGGAFGKRVQDGADVVTSGSATFETHDTGVVGTAEFSLLSEPIVTASQRTNSLLLRQNQQGFRMVDTSESDGFFLAHGRATGVGGIHVGIDSRTTPYAANAEGHQERSTTRDYAVTADVANHPDILVDVRSQKRTKCGQLVAGTTDDAAVTIAHAPSHATFDMTLTNREISKVENGARKCEVKLGKLDTDVTTEGAAAVDDPARTDDDPSVTIALDMPPNTSDDDKGQSLDLDIAPIPETASFCLDMTKVGCIASEPPVVVGGYWTRPCPPDAVDHDSDANTAPVRVLPEPFRLITASGTAPRVPCPAEETALAHCQAHPDSILATLPPIYCPVLLDTTGPAGGLSILLDASQTVVGSLTYCDDLTRCSTAPTLSIPDIAVDHFGMGAGVPTAAASASTRNAYRIYLDTDGGPLKGHVIIHPDPAVSVDLDLPESGRLFSADAAGLWVVANPGALSIIQQGGSIACTDSTLVTLGVIGLQVGLSGVLRNWCNVLV